MSKLLEILEWLSLTFSFLTSSGDIIFKIKIENGDLRLSQLLLAVFIFIEFYKKALKDGFRNIPVNKWFLLGVMGFLCSLLVSFFVSAYPKKSLFYIIWYIHSVFTIIAMALFVEENYSRFPILLALYISSFFVPALFGIYQFFSVKLHLPPLLVQQFMESIPRANGFNYEPSYFFTYLSAIYFSLLYIYFRKDEIKKSKDILLKTLAQTSLIALLIITSAIIASTSKAGIGVVVLVLIILFLLVLRNFIIRKADWQDYVFLLLSLIAIPSTLFFSTKYLDTKKLELLVVGTGLFGTPAHSVVERMSATKLTWNTFLSSPIIGVGIGTEGAYAVKNGIKGIQGSKLENISSSLWEEEGTNIFVQILAHTGIFGFIWFMMMLFSTIISSLKVRKIEEGWRNVVVALLIGLLVELFILMYNQNYLRIYLWIHWAVVWSGIVFIYKKFGGEKI